MIGFAIFYNDQFIELRGVCIGLYMSLGSKHSQKHDGIRYSFYT